MRMKPGFLTKLALVCLLLNRSEAQGLSGGGGWFWAQYTYLTGLVPLKDALRAQGIDFDVASGVFGLGGEGGFWIRGFHLGGGGGSLLGGGLAGGMGWVRVGYAVPVGGFHVMPVVSGGAGGVFFRIRDRVQIPFAQLGTTPALETQIGTGGGLLGGALEVQKVIKGGIMVGLSAGILQGLMGWQEWEGENVMLQGGPQIRPFLAFVRLRIGGGGFYASDKN